MLYYKGAPKKRPLCKNVERVQNKMDWLTDVECSEDDSSVICSVKLEDGTASKIYINRLAGDKLRFQGSMVIGPDKETTANELLEKYKENGYIDICIYDENHVFSIDLKYKYVISGISTIYYIENKLFGAV